MNTHLKNARDFDFLSRNFSAEDLSYFEKEIEAYENSSEPTPDEGLSTILQWWEGLIDTKSLIDFYKDIEIEMMEMEE